MVNIIIWTIAVVTVLGLVLALVLYLVAQKFKVEEDPRIDEVEKVMPGANCGGCGFAGCRAFAEAAVKAPNLDKNFCPVGGNETMAKVAAILGYEVTEKAPMVAVVRCNGTCEARPKVNQYDGYASCCVKSLLYTGDTGCVCEYCMQRFHKRLKDEYGTVENLNERWNLNLFSQAYDDFSDVPPAVNAWHNPHMKYEWMMAHHQANIEFVHRQYDILKKYTGAPVGTDMMPINGMSYETMTDKLDIVMFNHYNVPENLSDVVFWFDFLRTLKDRPFWNTETATVWNGSTSITQFLKPEGYCRVNSWLPVALGGESNMYWLFRQHWAGHELVHGAVLTPEGRPMHAWNEIRQTAEEYAAASEVIGSTKVSTPVALHFTSRSWNLFEQQKLYEANDYPANIRAFHKAIAAEGLIPDVIGSSKALDSYKVLFSPMVMTLEDENLAARIRSWVEEGGVWVAGPMTDIRNDIGAHYIDRAMGMLEDLLGIRLDAALPNNHEYLRTAWTDGEEFIPGEWVECYTVPEKAEVLASVTAGHSALNGKAVAFRIPYGKGQVIVLGTKPSDTDLSKIIRCAYSLAGVESYETTGELLVIPRKSLKSDAPDALILCETAFREASIVLPKPMTNVLTGEKLEGRITVKPYDVLVLK